MQIIIPMSGYGERFRRAGYTIPKPLIEIEGKPIIAHVIDLFPGENNFFFICNKDHLDNEDYRMKEILKEFCPTGKVLGINPHKLGPVHAVQQIQDHLNEDEPVIVNYCDFTCYWDWNNFKDFVYHSRCHGAIPAYKGFHPHSLGNTNYAYVLEEEGWIKDIQEKQPYTNNRMEEYASSGTYYFSSAAIMSNAFNDIVSKKMDLNGEYYVSLAYKSLISNNKDIAVYPLQHFMQWGTPEDVEEYNYWSKAFKNLIKKNELNNNLHGSNIIPMAGLGQRFIDEGYTKTKPLIEVSGLPMVIQSIKDLPKTANSLFVVRSDMVDYNEFLSEIRKDYKEAIIYSIDSITEGQACTAMIGVNELIKNTKDAGNIEPITIGACDSGFIYDSNSLNVLMQDPSVDIIVWGIRGYANAIRNPEMYGWIDSDGKSIRSISVKSPLKDTSNDPIVLGTFTFKKVKDFEKATNSLIERNGRINGEFYLDSCIEDAIDLGLNCVLFEVDSFLCWGTPNDMLTFEYWQSCFHLWNSHDYDIFLDNRVPKDKKLALIEAYKNKNPFKYFMLGNKKI